MRSFKLVSYRKTSFQYISRVQLKQPFLVLLYMNAGGLFIFMNFEIYMFHFQLQDMRTQAAKQTTEVSKDKEDCKDLRNAVTDLRDKIGDLDARVRNYSYYCYYYYFNAHMCKTPVV